MKKTILTLVTLILTASTAQAGRRDLNYYVLDMTGRHFVDQAFNEMDDGIEVPEGGFDGIAVKLEGQMGQDFAITARGSEPGVTCAVTLVKADARTSTVAIQSSVEVDTGETCEYEIVYKSGARAVLSVYSEGT